MSGFCVYSVKIVDNLAAKRVYISGIVQGVGFRPFIFRLANKYHLKGFVRNMGGSEVEIHVEGLERNIEGFLSAIKKEKPPPAKIESIIIRDTEILNVSAFKIVGSGKKAKLYSMVPPDFGICEYCINEILDPETRFYRYPFNSCAWCGPRFSMIESLPYDRENTAMRDFPLCDECEKDYNDPENVRRFHIQGISCPKCGPKVWLTDKKGEKIIVDDPIIEAARLINEGFIVAIKGLGGFHIACLASDDDVVLRLRERKRRPYKPFALMALDTKAVEKIVVVNEKAREILESPEKPIVLLPEREDSPVSKYVAPGLNMQGVMLPYTGLHYLLLMETEDRFLIMTSGNKKGKPMCTDEKCAFTRLNEIVDYFLLHNRRIINRVDDSVLRFTDGELTFLRRSRGYAPAWIKLPFTGKHKIIAFGAELQNAGAVGFENKVVVTQFIGDTDEVENLTYLDRALAFFAKVYEIDPKKAILVTDKHPRYASVLLSEKWARKYGTEIIKVQHHFAHIVSVMAEKGIPLDKKVIGIAIDGLGYGDDGQIWGGEVFIASYTDYKRVGHLEYHRMPGGDLAVMYPVRMLVSILKKLMTEDEILDFLLKRSLLKGLRGKEKELKIIFQQYHKAPLTSSLGRILDAVSYLLKICWARTYEGEPAIKLEAAAKGGKSIEPIELPIIKENGLYVVETVSLFKFLLDYLDQAKISDLAYTAQYVLGKSLGSIAVKSALSQGIDTIVVSGGAAVNSIIIKGVKHVADEHDLKVYLPNKVPAGDGGIALGQVAHVAATYLDDN